MNSRRSSQTYLITGGAGFIGSNLAHRLLSNKKNVIIYDNFSRPNVEKNIYWLTKEFGKSRLKVIKKDIGDLDNLIRWVGKADVIFHLAAQVAVTTSVLDPVHDMRTNIVGTLNVLEAARKSVKKPIVIYASTNKVYGKLNNNIGKGISEEQPLDFHSPYGCSKGAADQYVRDYHRIYGLDTVVFRQSCVYGPRQFGVEDQGWLAHFAIQAINNRPITIFGDGKQIRDLLYIDDLIEAYLVAIKNIKKISGEVFNIGGGIKNSISLIDSIKTLERILDKKIILKYSKTRPGDQKVYISDNSKLKEHLGFEIKTGYSNGLQKLLTWLSQDQLQKK